MKKIAFVSMVVLFTQAVGASSDVSGGHVMTLNQALVQAYNGSNVIQANSAGSNATEEQLSQANKDWLPQTTLTLTGNTTFTDKKGQTGTNVLTNQNYQDNTAQASFQVAQNLYSGGATVAGGKKALYAVEASYAGSALTEAQVLYGAAKSYLELFQARTMLENFSHNVKVYEQQLAHAQAQYDAGTITLSAVESTRAKLEEARANLSNQRMTTEIAEGAYVRDIGEFPRYQLELPSLPVNFPKTQDEIIRLTLKNNYKILSADATFKAAEQDTEIAAASLLPKVDLTATLSRALTSEVGGLTSTRRHDRYRTNAAAFVATVSLPLDFRGSLQSKVREKKYTAAEQRLNALQTRRTQLNDVLGSWQRYMTSESKIKQYEAQVASTELALKGHQEEFLLGNNTYLDVIQATQNALEAKNNLVASQTARVLYAYEVLMNIGILNFKGQNVDVDVPPASTTEDIVNTMWGTSIDNYPALYKPQDAVVAQYEKV